MKPFQHGTNFDVGCPNFGHELDAFLTLKAALISDSANFSNKCDIGLIVYRDDDSTLCRVQKIRFKDIGRTGDIRLHWVEDMARFEPADSSPRRVGGKR